MGEVVLDAGALIAVERGSRRMTALLQRLAASGTRLAVPAAALAQVWRGGSRQARLHRLLSARETTVVPLDAAVARAVGVLCGVTGTSDVVDASVVMAARGRAAPVVTSDRADLERLDPRLVLFEV